jgi:hypothetical protein
VSGILLTPSSADSGEKIPVFWRENSNLVLKSEFLLKILGYGMLTLDFFDIFHVIPPPQLFNPKTPVTETISWHSFCCLLIDNRC